MTDPREDLRETVRVRYAAAATTTSCCGTAPADLQHDTSGAAVFGAALHGDDATTMAGSLGCGVPTAVADLHPGETVLELARTNAAAAGVANVKFLHGYLEDIPLAAGTVDVLISNCVLNLAADKIVVLREAARVLRPGGRLAFSDVIADHDMDAATKADVAAWTGCIAGALTHQELTTALTGARFIQVEIRPTHRVHPHAQVAIIRATLPTSGKTLEVSTD